MSRSDDDVPGRAVSGAGGEEALAEPAFPISRSKALVPLLVMFLASVLGIVTIIARGDRFNSTVGAPANKAYGPADFPWVFNGDVFATLEPLLAGPGAPSNDGSANGQYAVPKPPFSEDIFPCMECHKDLDGGSERRELKMMHEEIVLRHDEEHRWCLDCHDAKDRDRLRLASGALVEFTESYRLCGQCHGTQFRDWRSGIHGRRVGYWDGPKRYLLCVHCHNPHSPRFASIAPLPPPVRPQLLREESRRDRSTR